MKRMYVLMMLVVMIALVGCSTTRYDSDYVRDANWTEDGKIVYIREQKSTWVQKNPIYEQEIKKTTVATLWECDSDGSNNREIGEVVKDWSADLSYYGISSEGDYAVISTDDNVIPEGVDPNNVISSLYICNLNNGESYKIGYGLYPSLSPDGSKIVYKEWGGGIRMVNVDGSNDHVFLDDTSLTFPQWSPLMNRIMVNSFSMTFIYDEKGVLKKKLDFASLWSDTLSYSLASCWDTEDSNSVYVRAYFSRDRIYKIAKFKYSEGNDSLEISYYYYPGTSYKEHNGKAIAYDGDWLVCNIDGSNKWYLYTLLSN